MNATDQAKNSFKTFLITLFVSLVLFSTVYFVAANVGNKVDVESSNFEVKKYTQENNDTSKDATQVASAETPAGVFGTLAQQTVDENEDGNKEETKSVLGAGDVRETTQSTVPVTGISTITYAFVISTCLILLGFYFLVWEPRKRALSSFERRVTKNL